MMNKPADEQIKQLKAMGHDAAMKLLMTQPINQFKFLATYKGRSVEFYSHSWEPTKIEAAGALRAAWSKYKHYRDIPSGKAQIEEITVEFLYF